MSDKVLDAASHQWATRPADQRFGTLKELYHEAYAQYAECATQTVKNNRLGISIANGDIRLTTPGDMFSFNHWSFGQFCRNIGAPTEWCRSQAKNTKVVKDVLDASLAMATQADSAALQLFHNTETKEALAVSRAYSRVPNWKIAKKLMNLQSNWRTAPARATDPNSPTARPATAEDCAVSTLIQVGDLIDRAGLYMSQEDMFIFLVNPDRWIADGSDGGLSRGFFATNSEVGKKMFKLVKFYYRFTCGNHLVFGAENIEIFARKHIGENATADIFAGIDEALAEYENQSPVKDEAFIRSAQNEIWGSLDEVAKDLVNMGWAGFGKRKIDDAIVIAEKYADTDGSPRSPWGMANSVTRLSQITPYADERAKLDTVAGLMLKKFVKV